MYNTHNSNIRYKELDALRGIAALLVVFFHFTMGRSEYNSFFKLGISGVDLFFMISGFVIFMSLQKIKSGSEFVINRIGRLYPTYWSAVTFTFIIMLAYAFYKGNQSIYLTIRYIANMTMFQFYFQIDDLDGPYWSLIIEMLFYILFYFIYKVKILKYTIHIGISLCTSILILTQFFYSSLYVKNLIIWVPLFQFFPLFFAGINFYKIYTEKDKLPQRYLIILFCFICQVMLFPYAGRSNLFINHLEYGIMLAVYFILFILFVNKYLFFIVNKTTLFLGKISYALYLVHQYISIQFIIPTLHTKFGLNFWFVIFCIDLPIVIAFATFLTYKIEIPYSKLLKNKLRSIMFK